VTHAPCAICQGPPCTPCPPCHGLSRRHGAATLLIHAAADSLGSHGPIPIKDQRWRSPIQIGRPRFAEPTSVLRLVRGPIGTRGGDRRGEAEGGRISGEAEDGRGPSDLRYQLEGQDRSMRWRATIEFAD
jgi:hypothetical protein